MSIEDLKIRLISDLPIDSVQDDELEMTHHAAVLANSIAHSPDSLTYGVFGDRGSGKTSLMQMAKSLLDEEFSGITTVWFNAWQYEGKDEPFTALVSSIIRRLGPVDEKNGSRYKFVEALKRLAQSTSLKAGIGINQMAYFEMALDGSDAMETREPTSEDSKSNLEHFDAALSSLESQSPREVGLEIVVFIDDLDRCLPDNSVAILENIKLVLSRSGFKFVAAIDPNVLTASVSSKFPADLSEFADSYLDKIFQATMNVPDHRARIQNYANTIASRSQDETEWRDFSLLLPVIGSLGKNNPRSVKRFINNLLIDRALMRNLSSELSLFDLGLARSLQMHWPRVAEAIKFNDEGIVEVLSEAFIEKDISARQRTLTSAHDRASIHSKAAWEQILFDRYLKEIMLSEAANRWLSDPDAIHAWSALATRPDETTVRVEGVGESYLVPKIGHITNVDDIYFDLLRENGPQHVFIEKLWRSQQDQILERGNQNAWEQAGWAPDTSEQGRVLGWMFHYATKDKISLVEFRSADVEVFVPVTSRSIDIDE